MITLLTTKFDDPVLEQWRRNIVDAITELQKLPAAAERIIPNIKLEDGVPTAVPHGLGRPALWAAPSCTRGAVSAGRIDEVRDGKNDRAKYVTLCASGYGGTIYIDLRVL